MFRCTESFVTVDSDGARTRFGHGDLVPDDHWVLEGRESLFVPADVEQATAAPGEKRSTRRAKKAAASSDD